MQTRNLTALAAALVLAAGTVELTVADRAAALAQQRAQTDLEFTRERARITALERRVATLRQRLAELPTSAAGEHVLLGRGAGGPAAAGAAEPRRAAAARTTTPQAQGAPERRSPETLRHRDRAVSAEQALALTGRLDAATQSARALGERVNRPDFGTGVRALEQELEQLEIEIAAFE